MPAVISGNARKINIRDRPSTFVRQMSTSLNEERGYGLQTCTEQKKGANEGFFGSLLKRRRITWFILFSFLLQPLSAIAQVKADPNAGAKRPQVEKTDSGKDIVQITTPNGVGVSHNQYTQFNVGPGGIILNNSQGNIQTQIAGWVPANPFLLNGPARLILNEVTGTGRSYLNGFLEVAGQRADVIVANPNGITCAGCGFVNASRGVLTTGVPVFGAPGSLDAFRVTRGDIAIETGGLYDKITDRVDLIARLVKVNSEIWAKELAIVTGANSVGYTGGTIKPIEGEGNRPAVALDVAALGGMYAQKITMVGTERGVGVNSAGTMAALNGDLIVTNAGKVLLAGNTSASSDISIDAGQGLEASSSGNLVALNGSLTITSPKIKLAGNASAGTSVSIYAGQDFELANSGSLAASGGDLSVTALGNIGLAGAAYAGNNTAMYAGQGLNLESTGTLAAMSGSLAVHTPGKITLAGKTAANNTVSMNADQGFDLALTGTLAAQNGYLTITTSGKTTLAGNAYASADAFINAGQGFYLANTGSLAAIKGNLAIVTPGNMTLAGNTTAGGSITLTATQEFANAGMLYSQHDISVQSTGALHNTGTLAAGGNVSLSGSSIESTGILGSGIDSAGALNGAGDMTINVSGNASLKNQTLVAGNLAVNASAIDIADSSTQAGGNISLAASAGAIDNTGGTLLAGHNLTAKASGSIINDKNAGGGRSVRNRLHFEWHPSAIKAA